ncbi:hypothetical protein OCH239_02815 [Roseivivax halodurans JCM 10272]|uniref:Uncharacterized protein n=1 Tax=Roseivivax halodurans JCM 10272 TaxID=1449350 RepID=X7EF10_9RHOB|nr:hypothetical protein [Roseivivax halodurans]ETX14512.1 hypothetical protein OCH239_02815 [Roseivivax halodurans JCM 10272]
MRRTVFFLPVAGLVAIAAILGWRQGWIHANVTETQAIAAFAERYLADRAGDGTGATARAAECRGVPGAGQGAWLVVVCGPEPHDAARHYTYYVDRAGKLIRRVGPDDA